MIFLRLSVLGLPTVCGPSKLCLRALVGAVMKPRGKSMSAKLISASLVILALPSTALAASTVTYSYDALGQLVALSSSSGPTTSYSYDAAGNRTQMASTGSVALNGSDADRLLAAAAKNTVKTDQPAVLVSIEHSETDLLRSPRVGETDTTRVTAVGAGQ